jgi:small subunit ribosomal protein S3Ae
MSKKSRSGRVKDKWREKSWLVVEAPQTFNRMPVAYIPITDVNKAQGRVVETTLYDILKQDPQHYSQKLFFQVLDIEGNTARSILKGHEYSREYLRSLIRRGCTLVSYINDYTTKDEFIVRVYVVILTQRRINSSKKSAVRLLSDTVLKNKTSNLTYEQFAQEAVLGKVASDIYNEAKKITHLRHVGIKKMKVIKIGQVIGNLPSETEVEINTEEVEKTTESTASS